MVDPENPCRSRLPGKLLERECVGRVRRTNHHDCVAPSSKFSESGLAIRGGETEVAPAGGPDLRKAFLDATGNVRPIAVGERGLCEKGDWFREVGKTIHICHGLNTADRLWGNGHRADRLLVSVVPDVDDPKALSGPDLDFVMNLGH